MDSECAALTPQPPHSPRTWTRGHGAPHGSVDGPESQASWYPGPLWAPPSPSGSSECSAAPRVHNTVPSAPGAIRTASYTLISNTTGTVTLTINPKELFDAAALQSDLARYGIPAKVTTGSFCSSDPEPAGFSQVVSGQPDRESTVQAGTGEQPTMTFDPSAIPAGAELSFGNFQLDSGQQQADIALVDTSAYSCSSNPADAWSTGDLGILYGGPVGS